MRRRDDNDTTTKKKKGEQGGKPRTATSMKKPFLGRLQFLFALMCVFTDGFVQKCTNTRAHSLLFFVNVCLFIASICRRDASDFITLSLARLLAYS